MAKVNIVETNISMAVIKFMAMERNNIGRIRRLIISPHAP